MADSEARSNVSISAKALRARGGRIDYARVLSTTDAEIALQKIEDDHPRPENLGPPRLVIGGPNVRDLRAKFNISQEEFAARFGLSLRTLQQWEQKRRVPDGPAKLLLRIIEERPQVVEQIVHG